MSRRRYVSTHISLDSIVNQVAADCGDFAALLYTWMIPHAEDDTTITGDPGELFPMVCPARRDKTVVDVERAVSEMVAHGLLWAYRDAKGKPMLQFPPDNFYKYQTYIPQSKRNYRDMREVYGEKTPQNTENHRRTPQNTASPSLSPSPSPSLSSDKEKEGTPLPPNGFNRESAKADKPSKEDEADMRIATDFAQKNLGTVGMLRPVELDKLRGWHKQLSGACLVKAMEEAVLNGAPNWKYIGAIALRWIEAGVRQVEDIEALERDHEFHKAKDKQSQQHDSGAFAPMSQEDKRKAAELTQQLAKTFNIPEAVRK